MTITTNIHMITGAEVGT